MRTTPTATAGKAMKRIVLLIAACSAAAVGGVAAASALTPSAPKPSSVDASAKARPGSMHTKAMTPDPAGGPKWAVRSYTGQGGDSCVVAARLEGARFGPLVAGSVRNIDVDGAGSCADLAADGVQLVVQRTAATNDTDARTVIYGRVGESIAHVGYVGSGTPTTMPLADDGSFITVVSGLLDPTTVRVRLTGRDGTMTESGL